jgi:carboxypeptidase Q
MLGKLLLSLSLCVPLCTHLHASPLTEEEQATASALMASALQNNSAWDIVESLTTEIGPRLAGTEAEARAREWAVRNLKALGFSNVRVEAFEVPLWLRGVERAEILSPFPQPLTVTALGGSAATGADGVQGQVVVFDSLAQLKQAKDGSAAGKIVFVDEPMTRTQDGSGYGVAVTKRREAAADAKRLGAVAALIRSVGTSSHRFPHTGQMKPPVYGEADTTHVPAAALSAPDADQLRRALARTEKVELKLTLTPQILPPSTSGNVIAEIPGRESPEQIVLMGAHLDSWDLGTGAVDDGAGVAIVVAAAKLLLDQHPKGLRRTVRIVLFGSEEVGLVGAKAYAQQHADELEHHVVASESDFGAGQVWQFATGVSENKLELAQAIGQVLLPLGIGPGMTQTSGGPDIGPMQAAGVPVVRLRQNGWDYFDLHHTPNDTLDKINPVDLNQNVAAWTALFYLAAEAEPGLR